MPKREFLMLAHKLDEAKFCVAGAYWSEKLDGKRAFWDGGVTRGIPKSEIPWANHARDERYRDPPIATGLWSRYGNVIHAPDWWLDGLPIMPLDGELYPNKLDDAKYRQDLMSKINKIVPVNNDWEQVALYAYGIPNYAEVFRPGQVRCPNYTYEFTDADEIWMHRTAIDRAIQFDYWPNTEKRLTFEQEIWVLKNQLVDCNCNIVKAHFQEKLPYATCDAELWLALKLEEIVECGGEGIIVRAAVPKWEPIRSWHMLKLKPEDDAEGIVIGYTTGRETDKGSKLLGKMGALILDIGDEKRLELSGFTDDERELQSYSIGKTAYQWACEHSEEEVPNWIEAVHFPRGSVITYKYRGKSKDGIPQEARYWRPRNG